MDQAPLHNDVALGPAHGKAFWIHTSDDVRLRIGLWQNERTFEGTVLFFPGRTGYVERYGLLAEKLEKQGLASVVIDWRGHGLSDRLTGDPKVCHVKTFIDYQRDVDAMAQSAKQLGLPKPWHLVGSSMGACIGLRAAIEGLQVASCGFVAPMWGVNLAPIQRAAAWPLSWAAQTLGKGHTYAPGQDAQSYVVKTPFAENTMTHDEEMYQHFKNQLETHPSLQLGGPSMGWLFECLKECRALSTFPSPNIPSATFCGSQDKDVDAKVIKQRMINWPNGQFEIIPDAKHDILSERTEVRDHVIGKFVELFRSTN